MNKESGGYYTAWLLIAFTSRVSNAKKENGIRFTCWLKTAVVESDIIMIAVGTPECKNGDTDISQLLAALKTIACYMDNYKIIAIKSTVPVGTCEMAASFVRRNMKHSGIKFDIVSNPEFLREGSAVRDFICPERIITGADSEKPGSIMEKLYDAFEAPIISTGTRSAEMIKYACNTYLATRISFINEIAEICEKVGADINAVIAGMKPDKRIGGSYLSPGPGFGGPCLSKDLKSLIRARNMIPAEKAIGIGYQYKGIGIQDKPLSAKQEQAL